MRLLFVIDNLGSGGSQRQMASVALELARRGHNIDLFAYHPEAFFAADLRDAGITIIQHEKSSRFSMGPIFSLRRQIGERDYDLILAYLLVPSLYSILASLMTRHRPLLVVSDRSYPYQAQQFRRNVIERFFRFADHVIVCAHHHRQYFIEKYRWMKDRITTTWPGLDLEYFSWAPPVPRHGRLELIAIGNVVHTKNWLCLIDGLAIARERYGMTVHVDWIGRRTNLVGDDAKYQKQMETAIRDQNLTEQWTWLDERSDIPEQLHRHHALVHPSYEEGLSNVVCEALACGRPVILSDTLDHPKLIQHEKSGYLFDWRDPASLAQQLCTLQSLSAGEYEAMCKRARAFAEEQFSLIRLGNDNERLFEELLAMRRQTS